MRIRYDTLRRRRNIAFGCDPTEYDPRVEQLKKRFGGSSVEINNEVADWCAEHEWCLLGVIEAVSRTRKEHDEHLDADDLTRPTSIRFRQLASRLRRQHKARQRVRRK